MPLTNTQYASVMRVYDDIRSHNQALQTERYNEVVNKCPEYSLIENEIITLSMKEASRRIVSDSSDTDLDEYNLKLKKLIARKLNYSPQSANQKIILMISIHVRYATIPVMLMVHVVLVLRKRLLTLYMKTLTLRT